jgi:glycosyltransferase involved in cell wall biosynthesis
VASSPLVSVVITFYNTPAPFLAEAIESVLHQTYQQWELLLVDDGSAHESTQVARHYADTDPRRIRYADHDGHANRGMSASRQLGISAARGAYVGFLDSDDVWLSHKLADQVSILESCPEAGMVYGNTLYWSSWSEDESIGSTDFMPRLGVSPNRLYLPPGPLPLFLCGRAAVPCTCSILVPKWALERTGGFEAGFRHLYEDQVFYAKMCLELPVYVSDRCWDKYRQHPSSSTARATPEFERQARHDFLQWLDAYVASRRYSYSSVTKAIRDELWWLNRSRAFRRVWKPIRRRAIRRRTSVL